MKEEQPLTFSQKMWLAFAPALLTFVSVAIGLGVQWYFFFQKTAADQQQWKEKLDADQKQTLRAFQASQEQSDKQRAKEFRLKYYERQLIFFTDLCEATSHLAMATTPLEIKKDIDHFYSLLIGNLALMSDRPLEILVIQFWEELGPLKVNEQIPNEKRNRLQVLSVAIAKTCRKSLEDTFGLDKRTYDDLPPGKILLPLKDK